jgi:hypothetical protein
LWKPHLMKINLGVLWYPDLKSESLQKCLLLPPRSSKRRKDGGVLGGCFLAFFLHLWHRVYVANIPRHPNKYAWQCVLSLSQVFPFTRLIWATQEFDMKRLLKKPGQFITLLDRIMYSVSLSETDDFHIGYIRCDFMLMSSFPHMQRLVLNGDGSRIFLWKIDKTSRSPNNALFSVAGVC